MGCCHACDYVEFFLEEDDGDEVVGFEPDHVVHSPVERTQLICVKVIVLGDGEVELKCRVALQSVDCSVLCEDGFGQGTHISYF